MYFMRALNLLIMLVIAGGVIVGAIGCTTAAKAPKALTINDAVVLEVRPEQGREEKQKYRSHSYTKTFEAGQIRNEKEEIVDFVVHSVVDKVDVEKKIISSQIETVEKDGTVDLSELAFPEMGEVLLLDTNFRGEILRAGEFPPNSIYYVPLVSLPKTAVKVGDTWELVHTFVSLKNGLPMRIEVVSILKGFFQCSYFQQSSKSEKPGRCADIEVSGEVFLPKEVITEKTELRSRMHGRILFSLDTGSQIWSEMRNDETLLVEGNRVEVVSCLESILVEPSVEAWSYRKAPLCNPIEKFKNQIPGL